jgi:hypothetical protein
MGYLTPRMKIDTPRFGSVLTGDAVVQGMAFAGESVELAPTAELTRVVGYLNGFKFLDLSGDLGFEEAIDTLVDTTRVPNGRAFVVLYAENNLGFRRTQAILCTVNNS